MNVKRAFLKSYISEDVYVYHIEFEDVKHSYHIYKLKTSLYSLKLSHKK